MSFIEDPLDDPLANSPLPLLKRWIEEASDSDLVRNHEAVALATVDASGTPQVRMVMCRGFDVQRGHFTFFTNRDSPKAKELESSGQASALFYWDALGRQARISGRVDRASEEVSDANFETRHPMARVTVWMSAQSEPISDRAALQARFDATADRLGAPATDIPRPENWGGYVILADRIELWMEGRGRPHDRVVWTRTSTKSESQSQWEAQRLQP